MPKYAKNLTGIQITDEVINRSSSAAARLRHDTIRVNADFEIWTAAGGTGTQLTGSDYTLSGEDTRLSTEAGFSVYTLLAITNGAYHSTDLYVTYKTVGDYADADDVNAPPSIGDFNISAANATPSALTVPSRFRVSWHSGDGSHTFAFSDTSGITLNGIALAGWVGQGTGHLDIMQVTPTEWQTFSVDIWDSDGGDFTGTFEKRITGVLYQGAEVATSTVVGQSTTTFTWTFPIQYAETSSQRFATNQVNTHGDATFANSRADAATGASQSDRVFRVISGTGGNWGVTTALAFSIVSQGRWTTLYPRIS